MIDLHLMDAVRDLDAALMKRRQWARDHLSGLRLVPNNTGRQHAPTTFDQREAHRADMRRRFRAPLSPRTD